MTAASVLVPAIIWGVVGAGVLIGALVIIWLAVRSSYRANRATVLQGERFQAACRQLQAANDAVITQLEADHSLAGLIPQSVQDEVYAAHEAAASTEGKSSEWHAGRELR